ncbi:hypothetical protein Cgig2_014512 [Carnegiea gigantea]|uniref:LOB domain-containing protein n=1 Tax=Carnegiea gigantea TaxID=171969 RepID=A0A9Q1KHD4_9CARY|nr:hypothetical protein Cgig2_014512 [Carnegiea gigantea]
MESSCEKTSAASSSPCTSPPHSSSANNNISNNSNSPMAVAATVAQPPNPAVIMSPCAACKILRRRCAEKCVLAPYFPPTDPLKFTIAHKVFGASNIIKLLQDLPESQRADAVSSMVYEANARLRDPVYGCAGAICQLQKQVSDLQAELAKARAEIVKIQCQQANLLAFICMEVTQSEDQVMAPPSNEDPYGTTTSNNFLNFYDDGNNLNSLWEPLWT